MRKVYSYQLSLKSGPIKQAKAEQCFAQALAWWTRQTGIQFVEAKDQPNIIVSWQEHPLYPEKIAKCEYRLCSTTSTSTYYITFDPRTRWTASMLGRFFGTGEDLRLIAAHEVGHALGLGHSEDTDCLMFPNPVNMRLGRAFAKKFWRG